ncbi:MAG: hypothetical protein K1Y36_26305 [Blastocatellia bacterium]|nr:hypothetical protein [Blastocatellia bacterium]
MEKVRAAVAHYNKLLEASPATMAESRDFIRERIQAEKMIFGGRPLSPYLRPHFLSTAQWNRICDVCNTIWSCVEVVGKAVREEPRLMDDLGITPGEAELIKIEPGFTGISVTSRLDSFLADDTYSFVELNAENPAGISYCEVMGRIFMELPVMKEFVKDYPVEPLYARHLMLETLLTAYKEWSGGRDKPRIAIVDWEGLPTQCEFEQFKEFFIQSGYECEIAAPEKLDYSNGRLRFGDFEIDLVYRRVLTNDILEKPDECKALVSAYRNHDVCVVNGFRTKFVHKKMFFGVLTDEANGHFFTETQKAAIRAHIPWTRRMAEAKTQHYGEDIDLLAFTRANRDRMVLKPNDEYGGKGIFIGWESSESEWDAAIQTALTGDYLVQERVKTAHEVFPHYTPEGDITFIEQLVDLDPLLFYGKVGGAFTRLSSTALCNVTSGGGMVPTFVLK